MNPRDEIEKIREQVDKLEASLRTPNELDEAIRAVLNTDSFIKLESQTCERIVLSCSSGTWSGRIEMFSGCTKPLFNGTFYVQRQSLSAIERLDEVFGRTQDC